MRVSVSLRSQRKQFSSGGEAFAESIAYASFWVDALACLLYFMSLLSLLGWLFVLMCAWHLCSL